MQVLAQMQIKKPPETSPEPTEIQADVFSAAGALIIGVSIVVTLVLAFSLFFPALDGVQTLVVAILAMICWGYLLNSFTEKLKLTERTLEFSAVLSHHQSIRLDEVLSFKLVDLGLSLSGNRYAFEISVSGKNNPIIISLGPCWNKARLAAFIKTFGKRMEGLG